MPDAEHHAGALARSDHRARIGQREGQGLFAEHRLAGLRARDDLFAVQGVRRGENDRIDFGVREHAGEVVREVEAVLRGETGARLLCR